MLAASVGDNEQEITPTLAAYQDYFGMTYAGFVRMGIFMQVRATSMFRKRPMARPTRSISAPIPT